MSTELATIDEARQEAILRAVGVNIRDPQAQALLLVCERYDLDPLLKHVILIQGRIYVTRDGLLHVAHRSGRFDGIEVLDQSETGEHHVAKVAVWRKDMRHPFTYIGRYPKQGSNKSYGPEMAVKCAEVMGLRRAFDVAIAAREEQWADQEGPRTVRVDDVPQSPSRFAEAQGARQILRETLNAADGVIRKTIRERMKDADLPIVSQMNDEQIEQVYGWLRELEAPFEDLDRPTSTLPGETTLQAPEADHTTESGGPVDFVSGPEEQDAADALGEVAAPDRPADPARSSPIHPLGDGDGGGEEGDPPRTPPPIADLLGPWEGLKPELVARARALAAAGSEALGWPPLPDLLAEFKADTNLYPAWYENEQRYSLSSSVKAIVQAFGKWLQMRAEMES